MNLSKRMFDVVFQRNSFRRFVYFVNRHDDKKRNEIRRNFFKFFSDERIR